MWFIEQCTWVLGYLWDSVSLVRLLIAAVCATLGYFVVGLHKNKKLQRSKDDMAASQNRFALLGDEDSGLTPEEADDELEKVLRLSRESWEREKKSREKNRAAENRYNGGAVSAGYYSIPSCEDFSKMSLLDRVNIVKNLGEPSEGDGHELLEDLPPEERPKLLAEMGKRKVAAAKLAGHGVEAGDAFLPPPAMPPPRGATGGAVPKDEEEEDYQLALALSRSEAQTRGSTPATPPVRPTPPRTPQRQQQQPQQQQQPRLSDQERSQVGRFEEYFMEFYPSCY